MSRWPVTGPSEYWLIASSPASKVKKQTKKTRHRWRQWFRSTRSLISVLNGGVGGQRHVPRQFTRTKKHPVPIVQGVVWAPGLVWSGSVNLVPTDVRTQNCPARSESLYWPRQPGPPTKYKVKKWCVLCSKGENLSESCLNIHSVPHCKHTPCVIKTSQLMLHREIPAASTKSHTTMHSVGRTQNLWILNLVVYRVTSEP